MNGLFIKNHLTTKKKFFEGLTAKYEFIKLKIVEIKRRMNGTVLYYMIIGHIIIEYRF